MSNALTYTLDYHRLLENNRLKVYYNFETGAVVDSRGIIYNQSPAHDTSMYSGEVLSATTESQLFDNFLEPNGSGNLGYSNVQLLDGVGANSKSLSVLVDYEQYGTDSCVLFGGLDRFTENSINAASGYNFGINSFNRMFFQHQDNLANYILSSDIDLSQRNIMSFSVNNNKVEMNRHDYNRNIVETNSFFIQKNSILNFSDIFIGGAKDFYRTSDKNQPSASGYINHFLVFSGYLSPNMLHSVGSGLVSTYATTGETTQEISKITGHERTLLYPTNYTGYSIEFTSSNIGISGESKEFGGSFVTSTINEGETYLTGEVIGTDYIIDKESLLINPATYTYNPTGTEAFDTLGLREVSEGRRVFSSSITYSSPDTTGFISYTASGVEGQYSEPTGYIETPLYTTETITAPASSGISLDATQLEKFNYNYIFYKGDKT